MQATNGNQKGPTPAEISHWVKENLYFNKKLKHPTQSQHANILRMSTTLTSDSHFGCRSSTNKNLDPYNFCIQKSNKTYFGMLELPANC